MNRKPTVAGLFYPAEKKELEKLLKECLNGKPLALKGKLKALIVPHAGYVYSGSVAGKGFQLLKELNPKKEWEILLLGPSHTIAFEGAALSEAQKWETPLGTVSTSKRSKKYLSPFVQPFENAHWQEHCLEVQIPFLQKTVSRFSIVPIVVGEMNAEVLAIELENKIKENTLLIASSDLSHYFPYEKAVEKDQKTIQTILELDIEKMEKTGDACGKTPILTLLHIAKQKKWKPVLLEYKNSGDIAGEKKEWWDTRPSRSRGHETGKKQGNAFTEGEKMLTEKEKETALRLARETIQAFLENRSPKIPVQIPKGLLQKKGVFVTLTKNGKLRGCIGNLENWQTVWEGIQENSLSAAFNDPRFLPLSKKEWSETKIEISVLSMPKPMEFHSPQELLQKLVPNEHGIILENHGKRATFLPSVWEELPKKEQFLSHLCMKAGLNPSDWQSRQTKIWFYTAFKFEEK